MIKYKVKLSLCYFNTKCKVRSNLYTTQLLPNKIWYKVINYLVDNQGFLDQGALVLAINSEFYLMFAEIAKHDLCNKGNARFIFRF